MRKKIIDSAAQLYSVGVSTCVGRITCPTQSQTSYLEVPTFGDAQYPLRVLVDLANPWRP
jgi:hypothetical protein